MNNLQYLLALNKVSTISPKAIAQIYQRWPNLETLFALSEEQMLDQGLPKFLAHALINLDLNSIKEDLQWMNSSPDHHILSWDSADYPLLLKEIASPPVILYAKGKLSALKQTCLAMVGSRNPTPTGSENARHFAREIASFGITIVSGLALGIDAQAHVGSLEAQGQTVAVLGTGIDCVYPRRHIQLAQQISQQGLLLSEFPLHCPPIAANFPRRNRIISGLSQCTLVVEAAIKSGSLITAHCALDQNRDVLAIPGSIHNPLSRGCHFLLQQGAKLVTTAADVLDELNIQLNQKVRPKQPRAGTKSRILKYLGHETVSIDQLLVRSGLDMEQILGELSQLELNGAISSVPGGYVISH